MQDHNQESQNPRAMQKTHRISPNICQRGQRFIMDKKWYMYVVECADGTFYTGITTDITRRLNEHNYGSRGAKYTKSRRPVKLRLTQECHNHSSALKEEYKFKKLTRKQKKEIIDGRS